MRLVFTFFLTLFFLLLRGDSNLFGLTRHESNLPSTEKLSQKPGQVSSVNTKNTLTIIESATLPGAEDEILTATETEDDELISPRKFTEISNYFLTFFHSNISGYFNQYLNNRLPFCKHFSYTSSDKYIVQRVIRV